LGMELLFIVSVLIWLGLFLYLLSLHLQQKKLARTVEHMLDIAGNKEDDEEF
jgi:CcmD family protein